MKLFTKILLAFIAITVVFTAGGSHFIYTNVQSLLQAEVSKEQALLARQIMDEIDIFLYERMQDIRTIGQAPSLINAIAIDDPRLLAVAERKMKEFFNTTGPWDNLFIFDTQGKVRLYSYGGQDLLQRPGLNKAFQSALKGDIYFSDAILSLATNRPTVFFAVPMKNLDVIGGPIVGVAVGELAWPAITEYLEKISQSAVLHLYNGQGLLVGSNQPEHKKEIFKLKSSSTIDDSVLAEKEAGSVPGTQSHEGVEVLQAYAKEQGHLSYVGNRWLLMIETPIDVAFGAAGAAAFKSTMQLVLMFVLFSAVILWLISRYGIGPIADMARQLGEHRADDFSLRLPVKTRDEVGALANKFNELADANQKAYEKVEEKVAERTVDLELANKDLARQQKAILNALEDVEKEKENTTRERDKINLILQSIGDGVFVVDRNYKVIVFNKVAENISGFSAKEAIGRRYDETLKFVFEKDEKVNNAFVRDAIEFGEVKQMANHTVLVRRNGHRVPVADSAAPFRDKSGVVAGCVVVFRDVTQEREIDRMKSEFVSVASHQLRTPLTGIKWFTELLQKKKLDPTAKDYLKEIAVSNERMVRLVDDLLNVSRIETGRKFDIVRKDVNLVEVVKSVIAEQLPSAAEKKIKLSCAADAPAELILSVDELKMRQVFQNLVSNAIKYSKEKTEVVLGCRPEKDEYLFYVKDQGVGIPLKQQSQVFSKFFRADNIMTMHTDGTGLGLYIVKAIVEAHGGRVWFESVENKGTTFYFTLPTKA